jgi:hypothetical protein
MTDLNDFERAILAALLNGDHSVLRSVQSNRRSPPKARSSG